jgi:hypothetical protein
MVRLNKPIFSFQSERLMTADGKSHGPNAQAGGCADMI